MLTLGYTVRTTDNSGVTENNTDTQTVTVTITGTNDAPDIHLVTTDNDAATPAETNAPLSTTGTLTLTDADVSDPVTAAVVSGFTLAGTTGGLTSGDVQTMLPVPAGPVAADPADTHNLTWTFNS